MNFGIMALKRRYAGETLFANVQDALNLAKEQAGVIGAWSIEKMMAECHVPSAK